MGLTAKFSLFECKGWGYACVRNQSSETTWGRTTVGHRRRTTRPVVESVESRALLSAGLAGAPAAAAMVSQRHVAAVRLNGTVRGEYQISVPNPDVGTTYQLAGAGRVGGFGHASLAGQMHS